MKAVINEKKHKEKIEYFVMITGNKNIPDSKNNLTMTLESSGFVL